MSNIPAWFFVMAALVASQQRATPLPPQQPLVTAAPCAAEVPTNETDPDYIQDCAFLQDARRPGRQTTYPTELREVKPVRTPDAIRRGLEGEVRLKIRIGADGTVEGVRVVKSLDRGGLDVEAMKAARQWLFRPARGAGGEPVTVLADLILTFQRE